MGKQRIKENIANKLAYWIATNPMPREQDYSDQADYIAKLHNYPHRIQDIKLEILEDLLINAILDLQAVTKRVTDLEEKEYNANG